jgi:hypothetical protein
MIQTSEVGPPEYEADRDLPTGMYMKSMTEVKDKYQDLQSRKWLPTFTLARLAEAGIFKIIDCYINNNTTDKQ